MRAATRAIVLLGSALALATLLNAAALRKTAETQAPGVEREVAVGITTRLLDVSHALYLDRPRREVLALIGRRDEDRIDTEIALSAAPLPLVPRLRLVPRTHVERKPAPARVRTRRKPRFTSARPLRIWIAGDSLAELPGQALQRVAGGRKPILVLGIESRLSTGLGRPDLYNWFTRVREAIPELRPNVAVLSFGADDAHDYLSGVPIGHKVGRLGSASWDAEYRRRAAGLTRELNANGIYVVWLGLPITRGDGYRHSFAVVNRLLRAVAADDSHGAAFVDTWHMLANRRGRYTDYLDDAHGNLVRVRAADGVHYTSAAADRIAHRVLSKLDLVYELANGS